MKLREDWCGRDARAPGWASSHDRVTPTGQKCRSILAPVVVEAGPSVLVTDTNACAWWLETGPKSSMSRLFDSHRCTGCTGFFRRRLACVPGHPRIRTRSSPESASPAAASRPDYPVHPVHRCSIYSPSGWICPVVGGGGPARRQTGVSQRGQAGFQRSRPPDTPHLTIGTTPTWERGRPARMLSLRLPLSFPAMLQPTALPAGTAGARPKQRQGAAAG